MTEAINQNIEEEPLQPLQKMKDLTAQWANYFNGIQQVLDENERLQQRVAALENENAASTWIFPKTMSAAMRASARSARSRLWNTTRAGWTLSA